MTILTAEKFEFLSSPGVRSTKSCSGPSKSPAISGKPGALKETNLVVQKNDCPCISLTGLDLYLA